MNRVSCISKLCTSTAFVLPLFLAIGCGDDGGYNPRNPLGEGPAPVSLASSGATVTPGDLGAPGNYTVLAKAAISTTGATAITGNIGLSPAAGSFFTGFSETLAGDHATSIYVVGGGFLYGANYGVPTPSNLTTAIDAMLTGYNDAAARSPADFNELSTGNLGGSTLTPGLYKWTSSVTIPTDMTISGGANDVWIFQTTGDVSMTSPAIITLAGGAQAKNIFWQVAGTVTIGNSARFVGTVFGKTSIAFQTSARLNGRAFSQTQVTLDANTITP